ncbi:MAG: hypothetical protein HC792_05720 [Acaryochloridaceae cyanobacterium CSU_5_19]|nr:hypothetical protein [Acaryochloridaceae cyanobacterium CSU_5_19]
MTGSQVFSKGLLPNYQVDFNESDLLNVLVNVKKYFDNHAQQDPDVLREGLLGTQGLTIADIRQTLDFMISVLTEDMALKRPTRLKDSSFINTHFQVIKWKPS